MPAPPDQHEKAEVTQRVPVFGLISPGEAPRRSARKTRTLRGDRPSKAQHIGAASTLTEGRNRTTDTVIFSHVLGPEGQGRSSRLIPRCRIRLRLTLLPDVRPAPAPNQCQLPLEFATKPPACHAGAVGAKKPDRETRYPELSQVLKNYSSNIEAIYSENGVKCLIRNKPISSIFSEWPLTNHMKQSDLQTAA
jgi:hypothetical protein